MTLIISCFAKKAAIQVSDRRLTRPNGTPLTDASNKATGFECHDAYVAYAYTGLASIGEISTDRWLYDTQIRVLHGCDLLAVAALSAGHSRGDGCLAVQGLGEA